MTSSIKLERTSIPAHLSKWTQMEKAIDQIHFSGGHKIDLPQ